MQLRFVHKQRYAWVKYLVRTEGFMLAKPKKKITTKIYKIYGRNPSIFHFQRKNTRVFNLIPGILPPKKLIFNILLF